MSEALTGGYQVAFAAGAVMAALAAVIGGVFLRPQPMGGGAEAHGAAAPRRRAGALRRLTAASGIVPANAVATPEHQPNARDYPDLWRYPTIERDRWKPRDS